MKRVHLNLTLAQANALRLLASSGWSEKEFDDAQKITPIEIRAMAALEDAIEKATGRQLACRLSRM